MTVTRSPTSVVLPHLSSSVQPDLVPPAFLSVPDGYDPGRTLGPEVAAVATLAGFPPDPEQRLLLDVSFALDKRGRFLVFETVLIAPRQNLKTGFEKQRALGKLFVCDRPLQVWSAHEFDTSRRALLDLEALIDGSDVLKKQVRLTARGKVASHGAVPEITLNSGATLAFRTRTAGGGAGLTGDDLAVDEAWAAQSGQMGVILPIMLARPNSQVDFLSSACRPESAYLWDLVQRGRAGGGPRMLYAEWCAPPPEEVCDLGKGCDHRRATAGCGCDKPEVIIVAHSAVTRGRIELEKVTDLRRTMPEDEFPREIMGWHDEPVDGEIVIDPEQWAELEVDAEVRPGVIAVDGSLDGDVDIVGVDLGAAGVPVLQLLDHRQRTGGILDYCKLLDKDFDPVFVVDEASPVFWLVHEMRDAGLNVYTMKSAEVASAAAQIVEAVLLAAVQHVPSPEFDAAVRGVRARPFRDGGFFLGRRVSNVNIGPLTAGAAALWGWSVYGEGLGPDDVTVSF